MEAAQILEGIMLIVFGASWPAQIIKTIRVKNPAGEYLDYLHKVISTNNGSAEFPIHFAWNDPTGDWTIELRDAASGITVSKKITLK